MLFPTPKIDPLDHLVLEEVERMRDDLRHEVGRTPVKQIESVRKYLTADAVAASNSIEGFACPQWTSWT